MHAIGVERAAERVDGRLGQRDSLHLHRGLVFDEAIQGIGSSDGGTLWRHDAVGLHGQSPFAACWKCGKNDDIQSAFRKV